MIRLLPLLSLVVSCLGQNLLQNGDFELGTSGWEPCGGFHCEIVTDAHTGSKALKSSGRTQYYQGPAQILQGLKQNSLYVVEAYVKLLTDDAGGQDVQATIAFTNEDNSIDYVKVAGRDKVLTKDGYVQLSANFRTPNRVFNRARFYIQGPVPGQEFVVDSTSLTAVAIVQVTGPGQNFLLNPDFEQGTVGWEPCWGFHCEIITDAHTGSKAMKASGRTQYYQGPTQIVQGLKQNSLYAVEAYVKLLTDKPGDVVGQNIEINFAFGFSDKTTAYIGVAGRSMVLTKDGYVKMTGDLVTPSKAFASARFYFQGPIPGQEFAVDSTKITSLPESSDYLTTTNQVINQKRKSNINVKVTTAAGIDVNQLQIQINQVKKGFPFGTAVACDEYVSGDQRYQDFINAHFNWAVTENALKWGQMERQPGVLRNETAIAALKKLKSHGIKIRAHNMFWSVEKFVQSWVKALSPADLRKTVVNRIHTVMGQTQGLAEHWDVNNENLHGQYYQEKLQDRDFNLDLFRMAHQFDPKVKLFLNDYTVVAQGGFTGAYLAQALKFKNSNTGIYGIGVQCHFPANSAPNPTLIKAHLDTLAQAGLPIWVTELDVSNTDENERADWYETALRAFYGHPAVEGIMFWGFWSNRQSRGVPGSLVTGDEFRINPAGQRVLDLFENQWMTKESKIGTEAGQPFTVRGFHGEYEVKVIYNGKERNDLKQTFTLDPNDQTININVQ